MKSSLAGYARSGALSMVAQLFQMLGAVVLSVFVVAALSDREFGVLSLARQVTALVVVASGLALERVALRFLPELIERHGPAMARSFFTRTLMARALLWVPLAATTYALRGWLDTTFRTELGDFALVGVLTALVFSLHNHVRASATAHFAMHLVAWASIVNTVVGIAVTLGLLRSGYGINAALIGPAVGLGVATLVMLPGALPRSRPGANADGGSFSLRDRAFLSYTFPFAGIALLNFVVHSPSEIFFLGYFHSDEVAGFFQLGFTLSQRVIDFVPLALWEVSLAGFSQIAARDAARLPRAMETYLTLLYLIIAPLAMLGIAFSPSAIRVLYRPEMLPAAIVSQAYFVMAAYAALGAPIGMIVYTRNRVGAALRAYVVFAVVNVGLNLLFIPRWGLWGAIAALALAKLLSVLLMARIAWHEIPHLRVPWRVIVRAFAASASVLIWLLFDDRFIEPWQIFTAVVAALFAIVLGYRVFGVVGQQEQELIRATRLPLREQLLWLVGANPGGTA